MADKAILCVVTSAAEVAGFPRATGYWLGELTHAYDIFAAAGYHMDIVSPQGGAPPCDRKSLTPRDRANRAFLADPAKQAWLNATLTPAQIDPQRYQAIYYVGGHGAMADLAYDAALAALAAAIYADGGVVAAVCHGVAGLLPIQLASGAPLIAGQTVTGFTNQEEALLRLTKRVPYLLEDALRERGAHYRKRLPFMPHVQVSERIVSGQNPQSARGTARAVVKLLETMPVAVTTG